jgi:hypothetical protein
MNDWDYNVELNWVAYYTVAHFHQFPFWNPYKCGGMPLWANPSSRFLTPFFLMNFIVGPTISIHLEVILHLALMFAGCYTFARVLRLDVRAALVAGAVFCGSSWFSLHLGEGQIVVLPFAVLPWLLVCMELFVQRGTWTPALLSAVLAALIIFDGGVMVVLYAGPLVALFALAEALHRWTVRPLIFLGIAGALGMVFAAIKLVPVYELLREHPAFGPVMYVQWSDLPRMFGRDQIEQARDRFFIEFGDYISPAFLLLVAGAVVLPHRRVAVWMGLGVLVIFALHSGGGPYGSSVWLFLKKLPIYSSSLRLSSRFVIPLTFCVAMVAAYGAHELIVKLPYGSELVVCLLTIGVFDSLLVGPPFLAHAFDKSEQTMPVSPKFRQVLDNDIFDQTVIADHNMGMVRCYEYASWPTSALGYNEPGYRGEEYMIGTSKMFLIDPWTPNQLSFAVDAGRPDQLIINQNFDRHWSVVGGSGEIADNGGLLAIRVPSDSQVVTIKYE